jgi:hypothetical protein
MTSTENKTVARRVLEEVFPANDVEALRDVVSDEFVNHEAPEGTPPGLGSITMFMHLLNQAFSEQRWEIHDVFADRQGRHPMHPQRRAHRRLLRPTGHRPTLRL